MNAGTFAQKSTRSNAAHINNRSWKRVKARPRIPMEGTREAGDHPTPPVCDGGSSPNGRAGKGWIEVGSAFDRGHCEVAFAGAFLLECRGKRRVQGIILCILCISVMNLVVWLSLFRPTRRVLSFPGKMFNISLTHGKDFQGHYPDEKLVSFTSGKDLATTPLGLRDVG